MNASNDETKDAKDAVAANVKPESDMPAFGPPKKPTELGVLGRYRILKELGRGGMGGIYLGYEERLRRRVALKVMLPKFAQNEAAKTRFNREALAAAQLKHDNIVTIYDADEWNGIPFIAMEYLQGASLDDFLKKNPVTGVSQALRVGREVCSALAVAHKMGVAHRDIKPSNIWLEAPLGKAKILDFGLVKSLNPLDEAKLTTSGAIIGSPAYMSPEQARGSKIDHRTDIFSVGSVLYRMSTGQLPFQGDNLMDLLMALGGKEPRQVTELNPKVPSDLAALIHKMLSKNPDDRPQTAEEIAAALQRMADRRQFAASSSHAIPKSAAIRDTAPTGYTNSGEQVVAPIEVNPQEESAFDHIEESGPRQVLPPASMAETTRGSASNTLSDPPRMPVVVSQAAFQKNRTFFFAAIGIIFAMVFALTFILVRVLK
ncbi:serine/threonine-protein kinase [Limnoglobus roseus]|uniref:non-specific serine/threonine protein kinase n=1 Tax=Limnoglobus roseus TaxID=2598579 RepID=A0A5C1ABL2_9BACT|nr:serine/threonine-protein kinase [Limnoglobus roseus]QEL16100.1 serine/threonine protein kinase [Limnoglobus roseus]